MKIIDLTLPIVTGMPVYPNDPEVLIFNESEGKNGKCNISRLTMGSHTGTHIDMPYHFITEGKRIAEFPLEGCMGPGFVIQKPALPGEIISFTEKDFMGFCPGDILIVNTGWQNMRGRETYFENIPVLSMDSVELAIQKGARAFGFDTPSVDNASTECRIHKRILGQGLAIIESLAHLDQLQGRFELYAAPLLIADKAGGDGSPVRAFALVRE